MSSARVLLMHLIDGANVERDPWDQFEAINKQLAEHSARSRRGPRSIVLTQDGLARGA